MNSFKPAVTIQKPRNSAIEAMLRPDEKLVRVARISQAIYWKGIVVFLLAGLLLMNVFLHNLGILLMIVALIILANAYLTRYYLMLVLTDKRVLIRKGILNLDTLQMRLNKIESVELEWSPMGRILQYSVVVVTGTGSRVSSVPFVADGPAFRKQMDDMLYALEEKERHVVVDRVDTVVKTEDETEE
jgi:hypothetical protein